MRKGTRTVTTHQGLRLATGVVVENMGATVLVMIPGQHDVLTLAGPAAEVVKAVVEKQYVSQDLEPEVEVLLSVGVLASPMSRRNLLRAGAIGAGAGIAVLSMPSVAAASSPGGGPSGGAGGDDDDLPLFDLSRNQDGSGIVTKVTLTLLSTSGVTSAFAAGTQARLDIEVAPVMGNAVETWQIDVVSATGGLPPVTFESGSFVSFSDLSNQFVLTGELFVRAKFTLRVDVGGLPETFVRDDS